MPKDAPRIQFEDESRSSESDDDYRRGRGRDRDRDRDRDRGRDRDRDRDRLSSSRYSSGSDQPEVHLSREGSVHIVRSPRGGRGRGRGRSHAEDEIVPWFSAHCFRGGLARTRWRITSDALYRQDYPGWACCEKEQRFSWEHVERVELEPQGCSLQGVMDCLACMCCEDTGTIVLRMGDMRRSHSDDSDDEDFSEIRIQSVKDKRRIYQEICVILVRLLLGSLGCFAPAALTACVPCRGNTRRATRKHLWLQRMY